MRATGGATWLLLLSVLFHISEVQADRVTKDDNTTTAVNPSADLGSTSGAPSTTGSGNTAIPNQAPPTTPKPTPAVTTPANTSPSSSPNPTDKSISTQTQASAVPSTTPAPTISAAPPSVGNSAGPPTTTPSQPKTTLPAATSGKATTADSGGGSAVSSNTGGLQTSSPPTTSGTPAPVTLPGNVKTTKTMTDAPTSQTKITTHTAITTSQGSNGGAGAGTGSGQTSPRATESAGNTGTSSTPPTLTTAGLPAAKTTNAGTTSPPQTTTSTFMTTSSTTTATAATAAAQPKTFLYSLNNGPEKEEEKDLAEVCKRLLVNLQDGNCTLKWQHRDSKIQFDYVEINGKVKTSLASQYYEEITKKPTDNKTLIAILASCGALLIMIVILAVCASHHRKPYNENQQHLTEELHTVENGYHDNPTLEVMEVQPEMQEKKTALNGEFNDSWIVPIDNLLKDDIAGEEDTHL